MVWVFVVILGVICLGVLVLYKGESINMLWFVVVSICIYSIGYCFYSYFIVYRVLKLDDSRVMFVCVRNDGKDFVLIDKVIIFGYYFVVIVGVGFLVGLILVV